jgi:hypothetical protein
MSLELQDIFTQFGPQYRQNHPLPLHQLKTMKAIEACRTSILGGHVDVCEHCGYERISYNSSKIKNCFILFFSKPPPRLFWNSPGIPSI